MECGGGGGGGDRRGGVGGVGGAREEAGRVLGKERYERGRHGIGEFVLLDAVPGVEEEQSARAQHATCLREGLRLVGEEHHAELAHDGVELSILERQLHGVRLAPLHRAPYPDGAGLLEHRRIEVRGDDGHVGGQRGIEGARDGAGARCDLEHAGHGTRGEPARQVRGVGRENQRHEVRVVDARDRACEYLVAVVGCHARELEWPDVELLPVHGRVLRRGLLHTPLPGGYRHPQDHAPGAGGLRPVAGGRLRYRRPRRSARGLGQSTQAPGSPPTIRHFSYSMGTYAPECSGVPPIGSAPSSIMRDSTALSTMMSFTALLSDAITGCDVPRGAKKPNQEPASKPGNPESATVGVSGSERERTLLLTAIATRFPALMCAITEGMVANMNWMRPARRSLRASAPL